MQLTPDVPPKSCLMRNKMDQGKLVRPRKTKTLVYPAWKILATPLGLVGRLILRFEWEGPTGSRFPPPKKKIHKNMGASLVHGVLLTICQNKNTMNLQLAHSDAEIFVLDAPPPPTLEPAPIKADYVNACPFISVARGGGAGGATAPPPPIMLFRSFVGTFGNLSVHVSRQACHLYQQSIWCTDKILKEIAV